ncbi:MAG TPA: hypothetical protein VEB64_02210, partial [Azospirillaceae bacterium]|nr:hypothetical protein [Azospirillaceae bacterium]
MKKGLPALFLHLPRHDRGTTLVEYSMLVGLISAAVVTGIHAARNSLDTSFASSAAAVSASSAGAGSGSPPPASGNPSGGASGGGSSAGGSSGGGSSGG